MAADPPPDGSDEDVEIVTMRWPEDGADDETKARVLARNMAENGSIGEEQAKVYAFREVFDFPRGETAEKLDKSKSTVDELLYQAKDRIREARGLLEALDVAGEKGEGFQRRSIRTAVPRSEYRLMHDDFQSDVSHDRGESLAGNYYEDRHRGDVAAVFVREQAGERTDEGAPGYLVERTAPSGEFLGTYAVSAEYLEMRIHAGKLVRAKLAFDPVEDSSR